MRDCSLPQLYRHDNCQLLKVPVWHRQPWNRDSCNGKSRRLNSTYQPHPGSSADKLLKRKGNTKTQRYKVFSPNSQAHDFVSLCLRVPLKSNDFMNVRQQRSQVLPYTCLSHTASHQQQPYPSGTTCYPYLRSKHLP